MSTNIVGLAKRHAIASPFRGFYVIVPPEYRSLGCLPADQFIPDLMKALKAPYYAELLTAAQYHGAAHHGPQQFQVLVHKTRRPIACGNVRIHGAQEAAGGPCSEHEHDVSELAEKLDPDKLTAVAATAPLPWAQRLGYLLERVGAGTERNP